MPYYIAQAVENEEGKFFHEVLEFDDYELAKKALAGWLGTMSLAFVNGRTSQDAVMDAVDCVTFINLIKSLDEDMFDDAHPAITQRIDRFVWTLGIKLPRRDNYRIVRCFTSPSTDEMADGVSKAWAANGLIERMINGGGSNNSTTIE